MINWLSHQNNWVDISEKPTDINLSKSEIWQAIQSLVRRGLVDKNKQEPRSGFCLNSVFQAYIQSQLNPEK